MTRNIRFLPEVEDDVIRGMVRSEVAKSWRGIPTDVLCLR